MTDREKVEKALECCMRENNTVYLCGDCPYHTESSMFSCMQNVMRDALALLREQEARVMTIEEVEKSSIVWLEPIRIDLEKDTSIWFSGWAEPDVSSECKINLYDFGNEVPAEAEYSEYGKTWRCWTSRPSEQQMRDTTWEEV